MMESNIANEHKLGPDQVLPSEIFKTSHADGVVHIFKTETGPAAQEPVSVYTYFKRTADKYEDHTAMMVNRNGEWKKWSYTEYFNQSCIAAKSLIKLGLERFHGVCIMGYNSPEWMISNFGAIFAGGLTAGVYTTNSADACYTVAENCQAQIIIVEDKICLDKFLAKKDLLPGIKAIIQWSGEPEAEGVLSWDKFMTLGTDASDIILQERLSLAAVNQCCTLIYTSGTTGPPKGVMLSQDQVTWGADQYKSVFGIWDKLEVTLSYLPLSHLAAHMGDMYSSLASGAIICFAPPDALKGSLVNSMQEVRPTQFFAVPRVWEKFYEKMQEVGAGASYMAKTVASWAKYHGLNYYNALREGRVLSSVEMFKYNLAKRMVLDKIKENIGLCRTHNMASGAAPIDSEILDYFFSLDIPIMEGYGLSESLSLCSMGLIKPHQFKTGSVGKVLPLTEVRLIHNDELRKGEGEICIKGRNVCMGYLQMPELTDEAIDNDGWLHTGDLGRIDPDDFLFITGRLKELVITAGGENIPPILIEDAVKRELPCISNAMLIGDKRKYLTILLTFKAEVDLDTGDPLQQLTPICRNWLSENGCKVTTVKEAIAEIEENPEGKVATAIQKGIDTYNQHHAFSNAQKLQRWTFLPHDFSLPTEELNNTLKLKRSFVHKKYNAVIDKMYTSK